MQPNRRRPRCRPADRAPRAPSRSSSSRSSDDLAVDDASAIASASCTSCRSVSPDHLRAQRRQLLDRLAEAPQHRLGRASPPPRRRRALPARSPWRTHRARPSRRRCGSDALRTAGSAAAIGVAAGCAARSRQRRPPLSHGPGRDARRRRATRLALDDIRLSGRRAGRRSGLLLRACARSPRSPAAPFRLRAAGSRPSLPSLPQHVGGALRHVLEEARADLLAGALERDRSAPSCRRAG